MPPAPHASATVSRAAIVQAAERLVGKKSFARLTPAAVAADVGVPEGRVREVFPSKRSLVEAICVGRHEAWFTALMGSLAGTADPRDRLLLVFSHLESETGCCPCAAGGTSESMIGSLAAGHLAEIEQLVASLCAEAGLPAVLCDALVVLVEGAAVTATAKKSPQPVRAARTAAAMLLSVYEPVEVF